VGGFFPSLFGLFVFMRYFGVFFFETTFGYRHFHDNSVKQNHLGVYLKKILYGILIKLGMDPNRWKTCRSQNKVIATVNKMLDVNYLYKRIEYLERAISVLLDEHQLKGIYLTKTSIRNANDHYKRQRIRDKVVKYLHQRCDQEIERWRKEKIKAKGSKLHINEGKTTSPCNSYKIIKKIVFQGRIYSAGEKFNGFKTKINF
jgi:hypothetical protein